MQNKTQQQHLMSSETTSSIGRTVGTTLGAAAASTLPITAIPAMGMAGAQVGTAIGSVAGVAGAVPLMPFAIGGIALAMLLSSIAGGYVGGQVGGAVGGVVPDSAIGPLGTVVGVVERNTRPL